MKSFQHPRVDARFPGFDMLTKSEYTHKQVIIYSATFLNPSRGVALIWYLNNFIGVGGSMWGLT